MNKLTKISELISYSTFHWKAMGQLQKLLASKEYGELISFCDLMLTKNPTDYLAFYYRGLGHEEIKQFDLAINDFNASEASLLTYKRKKLAKEYSTKIPIQLSRVYRKKQDKEKAFEYADKAVQADDTATDGLNWRSSLKEDFGDLIGASEDLNEALKRNPADKYLVKMRDRLTYLITEDKRQTASR